MIHQLERASAITRISGLEYSFRYLSFPAIRCVQPQHMTDDGRRVHDVDRCIEKAGFYARTRNAPGDGHIHRVITAVVIRMSASAAMVRDRDDPGVFQQLLIIQCLDNHTCVLIRNGNLLQLFIGTESVLVARTVGVISLNEHQFEIGLLMNIIDNGFRQLGVRFRFHMNVDRILNDSCVDRFPAAECRQGSARPLLAGQLE